MQLKVRHHLHVLLDQSSVGVKVSWLLLGKRQQRRKDLILEIDQKISSSASGGVGVTLSMSLLMALSFSVV